MKRKASARHSELRNELKKLGEPTHDVATTTALNLVRSFNSDLEGMVKGSDIDVYDRDIVADSWWKTKRTFVMLNRRRYDQYKNEIRKTAPQFIPLMSKDPQNAFSGMSVDEDRDEFDTGAREAGDNGDASGNTLNEDGEEPTGENRNVDGRAPEGKTYNLEHVRSLIRE